MNLAILGMALGCIATILTATSYILWKIGLDWSQKLNTSVYSQITWWIGLKTNCMAQLFNIIALGLADQSTLSIASALTLIINAVFAWIFLKEELQFYKIVCLLLMCIGAGVSIMFASY